MQELASAKLGVGISLHLSSLIFLEEKYRKPYFASPFGIITNTAVFFNLMSVIDFVKIRKLKKKHKI